MSSSSNRRLVGRLLLLWQFVVAYAAAASDTKLRERQLQPEELEDSSTFDLVGAVTAIPEIFPFFTLFANGECAGTLISPTRVLTSASCVQGSHPDTVRVGATNRTDGREVRVRCAKSHPLYVWPKFQYDIAVLKINEKDRVDDIEFPVLNRVFSEPSFEGQPLLVAGMGRNTTTGYAAEHLMQLLYGFVPEAECKRFYGDDITLGLHVCADGVRAGTCFGDSGGPLLSDLLPRILVGVVSGAVGGCADAYAPDVYSSVAAFADWIDDQEDDESCDRECVGCLCSFYSFMGRTGYQISRYFTP
ncbi:Trypsin-like protease [Seminavis robusta]|uniref:Trypsin-like protease n=1 Tax=Seminavis robusta TaxID=568900 RepID=A0A9N8E0Z4_9STRA|nr:Trypsin-like protease [Seminavis robusta]|eukprot:Sro399_g134890.1 Trypsin-like protease (303) ;mRNA; r:38238-39248